MDPPQLGLYPAQDTLNAAIKLPDLSNAPSGPAPFTPVNMHQPAMAASTNQAADMFPMLVPQSQFSATALTDGFGAMASQVSAAHISHLSNMRDDETIAAKLAPYRATLSTLMNGPMGQLPFDLSAARSLAGSRLGPQQPQQATSLAAEFIPVRPQVQPFAVNAFSTVQMSPVPEKFPKDFLQDQSEESSPLDSPNELSIHKVSPVNLSEELSQPTLQESPIKSDEEKLARELQAVNRFFINVGRDFAPSIQSIAPANNGPQRPF